MRETSGPQMARNNALELETKHRLIRPGRCGQILSNASHLSLN